MAEVALPRHAVAQPWVGDDVVRADETRQRERLARGIKCGRAAACIVRDGKRGDVMIARQDEIGPDLV